MYLICKYMYYKRVWWRRGGEKSMHSSRSQCWLFNTTAQLLLKKLEKYCKIDLFRLQSLYFGSWEPSVNDGTQFLQTITKLGVGMVSKIHQITWGRKNFREVTWDSLRDFFMYLKKPLWMYTFSWGKLAIFLSLIP